jgi:uncharacterized protein (TIGR02466 family)
MKLEEQKIFFQSIFTSEIEVPEDIIQNIRNIKSSRVISNVRGWQSDSYYYSSFDWMQPHINKIGESVVKLCDVYGLDYIPETVSYWFNINKRGSYNQIHTHPWSTFSAVWYLTAPTDSGEIRFHRHDREVSDWLVPSKTTPYNFDLYNVTPEVGKVVLFPSYLQHSVTESNSDEERISVALNFGRMG